MINRNSKYQLEKYHGISSRHTCPSCGKKRCFTYYVNEEGIILDKSVGKCDHESSCGYHYTPKQYFHDHEYETKDYKKPFFFHCFKKKEPKNPLYPIYNMLPFIWVQRFNGNKNGLTDYLLKYMDEFDVTRVSEDYYIGGTKKEETVFWQIDIHGTARTAKIIAYQQNGHRYKDGTHTPNWVHSKLLREHLIPEGFELHQCLFGEHLIAEYPYRTIFLVEAEKTAVICSAFIPSVTWISCGGKSQINEERMKVLHNRRVVMIPDYDGISYWTEKGASTMRNLNVNVEILVSVYDCASSLQKSKGCDLADIIMDSLDKNGPDNNTINNIRDIVFDEMA